jgi:DNA repair protein RecN (Recombination protein N)
LIRALRVRNLAVIESLELELEPGLNVLTGETGAGKSVLLGAIAMIRGERSSSELVRSGAGQALVEALVDSPEVLSLARERGLAGPDDRELLVARSLARDGRGRVHVNGRLATVGLLGELLQPSIEVVSQGQQQQLLRPETQAELLDRYGGLEAQATRVRERYERWRELAAAIEARRADAAERARSEDRLRFELSQIDEVAPRPGEPEELEQERGRLAHVERLGRESEAALEALDSDRGLRERVGGLVAALRPLAEIDRSLADPAEALARAGLELDDAAAGLARYVADLEVDPGRLEELGSRLDALGRLRARYGETIDAILAYRERAAAELAEVGGGEQRTAELEAECEQVVEELAESARVLGKARREAATELEAAAASELEALDLGRAELRVRFDPAVGRTQDGREAPSGPRGSERASFQLLANPGEAPRRLRDAASGGELARLQLALRNVLRDADGERVLLFDEVDAGIGGRTARRVGERLRSLAARNQILCITHLPQIAALGAAHWVVRKRVRSGRTHTRVERVEADARVDEIARMSGGGRITAAARAHARELLGA